MAVSQDIVLDYLLENGGSVKNSDLLRRFKSVVDSHDPQEKANNRELFKRFVNNIAVVKDVEGTKFVVLRKKYSHLLAEREQVAPSRKETEGGSTPPLPASQDDSHQHETKEASQQTIAGGNDDLQVEVKLPDNVIEEKDSGIGQNSDLASASDSSPEEKGPVSSDEIEDSERKRVSVFDIVSRIDNTGPAPVPKPWATGEKNKGAANELAQKPFMLPLRYAQQSVQSLDDQEDMDLNQPSVANTPIHEFTHPAQPRSPHISRRQLDDTGAKSPLTKRSSKFLKVNDENKYTDVPLEASSHDWLVNSTNGRWSHILLGLLLNDGELAEKRDFISGFTALHWAAKSGNTEMVKILFDMSANGGTRLDVNVKSYGGYTPLHIAAIHNHKDAMIMLVRDYSAKVNIRDNSGRKPYQYLKKGASLKIRCLLNDPHATTTEHVFPVKRNSKVASSLLGTTSALLGVLSDDKAFHDLAKGLKKPSTFNKFFNAPTAQKKKVKARDSYPSVNSLYEEEEQPPPEEPVGKRRPVSDFFSHY
ncbi:ankyrin repeat domain-containing protein SOWAHA [Spea bombifrons]|uniref:ankyrin repeat domain-containing protein SOWAHA n=1 Tax=Spea bombifrons TaxID=233779 RepID=UPI0023499113|nr:ankyrin repeat domain-containing protein SOWAHA [Spea bombifrons]